MRLLWRGNTVKVWPGWRDDPADVACVVLAIRGSAPSGVRVRIEAPWWLPWNVRTADRAFDLVLEAIYPVVRTQ